MRPDLEKALAAARQSKEPAPEGPVIFTSHELTHLARDAAEPMTPSAQLPCDGVQLELLTGPLTGIYDPNGRGAMFFAVLSVVSHRVELGEGVDSGTGTSWLRRNRPIWPSTPPFSWAPRISGRQ
ncbi:hypothetical protein ACIPSA_36325 [Streptomyces sp. NPDC086549]|uniref:hypothetical protein n=1 Tax=Streptomyces sp. NPDC086549 TaxID=3365752 RepID=UPI003826F2FE